MKGLILAILLKAMEDWDDPKKRLEIEEFVDSEWFDELVGALNYEPATVRNQLRTGNYDRRRIRAKYR